MREPIIQRHDGISVVRDDLFPGGTKARFIGRFFESTPEIVYASPPQGGAQTALATVAKALGKRATIFTAKRVYPHARTKAAKDLGAQIVQVDPGYMSVCKARAAAYAAADPSQRMVAPFGLAGRIAHEGIIEAAKLLPEPAEFWCAAGSGVLCRALRDAWPRARANAVQVGHKLSANDVGAGNVRIWDSGLPFDREAPEPAPFPSDPHYDAKAWAICRANRGPGLVYFWNVTGPA